jgi:hypothetical protein
MKSAKPILSVFLLVLFVLSACNGKKAALVINNSPNGKVSIAVTGNRATTVDAWKVTIAVKASTFKEGKLSFEIYADDLNEKNVKFNWQDDKNCIITIEQREDKPRTFQLIADGTQLQLGEI